MVEEVVNYTLGDLLSDIGGILGFFLGLSLLQCLKQIWRALVQSAPMTFLTRCIHDSRHRSVSFKEINEKLVDNFQVPQTRRKTSMSTPCSQVTHFYSIFENNRYKIEKSCYTISNGKIKVTSPESIHVNTVHSRGVSMSLPIDYASLI